MRISDWSSDVCSSDLFVDVDMRSEDKDALAALDRRFLQIVQDAVDGENKARETKSGRISFETQLIGERPARSEEHTSELQSLMRISYAVFCLKKKKNTNTQLQHKTYTQLNQDQ